jgi:uncharacterized protein
MSRTAQYLVFYGIFCLVMLGMHVYVYLRLKKLFDAHFSWGQLALVALLAAAFPLCTLLEKFIANQLTMVCYALASVWLGIAFLLFSFLVLYEPVRLIFKTDSRAAGWILVGLVGVCVLYGLVNALVIRVKEVTLPMRGIEQAVRVVHLSDIHVGTIHNAGYLARIVGKVNALNPDFICITGDMFDGIGPVTAHTVASLKNLRAPAFFVTGNHEKYAGIENVTSILRDTGLRILRNEVIEILGIQVAGVDYPERENQKENPVVGTLGINPGRPCVLLYHAPVGLEDALQAGVDLQLSGHTHAGQMFPFNWLTRIVYPHMHGLYRIDTLYLYVSPGTGTWGPPMRIGSRSEITLIALQPDHAPVAGLSAATRLLMQGAGTEKNHPKKL